MAYLTYLALLALWPLLVWPLVRGPSEARGWLIPAVALGVLASAWEAWLWLGPGTLPAIRVDIPLLVVVLGAMYLVATVAILRMGQSGGVRVVALGVGAVTLMAVVGFSAAWLHAGREGARAMAVRAEGDRMLFEARFRDRATYRAVFGMDAEDRGAPAGHWQPTGTAPITRLVVNPAGRVVPFFGCGDTECTWGEGTDLVPEAEPTGPTRWRGVAVNRGVGEMPLVLQAAGVDTLRVRIRDREALFVRTQPPLGTAATGAIDYLGAFASVVPTGNHARVVQLWLWEDGAELLAVGVVETLVPGTRADYVTPVRLGRGVAEAEGHRFRWEQRGQVREARVEVTGAEVVWTPTGDGWDRGSGRRPSPGRVVLTREPVFRDEAIELAPLDDAEAWNAWMDVQLLHHFTSGSVPEVPERP